jgi:SRSO17 transposase
MHWDERRWVKHARDLGGFLEPILKGLGRAERRVAATRYVQGLLMPGQRKSIEPMAVRLGVDAQSLQQFVRDSPWSAKAVWSTVRREVIPAFGPLNAWIVGETTWPKKGTHSVGVARQYSGALGKQANCQVCVEVAVSDGELVLPVAGQLYLKRPPKEVFGDSTADVPEKALPQTKPKIAYHLLLKMLKDGVAVAPVLADNVYGRSYGFRERLRELKLEYCLQVTGKWLKGRAGKPGSLEERWRRHDAHDDDPARTLLQLVGDFKAADWVNVSWKADDGSTARTRLAWRGIWLSRGRYPEPEPEKAWLLVDWPRDERKPYNCFLLHLRRPPTKALCLRLSRDRGHMEQYFLRGKKDLGLDHYEGRSLQGFQHHLVLSALAYLFVALCNHRSKKTSTPDLGEGIPRDPAVAGEIERLLHLMRDV